MPGMVCASLSGGVGVYVDNVRQTWRRGAGLVAGGGGDVRDLPARRRWNDFYRIAGFPGDLLRLLRRLWWHRAVHAHPSLDAVSARRSPTCHRVPP